MMIFSHNKMAIWKRRLYQAGGNAVAMIYAAVIAWILFIVLLLYRTSVIEWGTRRFFLPNPLLLVLGGVIISACYIVLAFVLRTCRQSRFVSFREKCSNKVDWAIIVSVVLFVLQLIISRNVFFETGWDAGQHVLDRAYAWAASAPLQENWQDYFELYPNNIAVFAICELVMRAVFAITGAADLANGLYVLVVLQSALYALAGFFLIRIIQRLTKRRALPILGWLLYVFLCGLAPWFFIVYTDGMGIIFPICIIYLYFLILEHSHPYRNWTIMVLLAYWGYRLKATAIIPFLAILIIEGARTVLRRRLLDPYTLKRISAFLILGIVLLLLSEAGFRGVKNYYGIRDTGMARSPYHYLMMGLSEENDGTFNGKDSDFSMFIPYPDDRKQENIRVAKERVQEMFPLRLLQFYVRKTLVNFNDGTFAYGKEGLFYYRTFDQSTPVALWLQSIYWDTGSAYPVLAELQQMVWLAVLALNAFRIRVKDRRNAVLQLSMIGIFLFVMLFE